MINVRVGAGAVAGITLFYVVATLACYRRLLSFDKSQARLTISHRASTEEEQNHPLKNVSGIKIYGINLSQGKAAESQGLWTCSLVYPTRGVASFLEARKPAVIAACREISTFLGVGVLDVNGVVIGLPRD